MVDGSGEGAVSGDGETEGGEFFDHTPLLDTKTIKKPAFTLAFVSYWNVLDDELVEVRGIEPLSENIQHNSPTCVADDLKFAVAHAHRLA